ncbi:putative Glycosyl transferase family 2 [Crenothrix polyspora]|uniref:Putative Glycosyl transferase family 2 n=1 Tax=Crenothrix polyspora TaxID=360316 RepID=A0A1R4HIX1_9GAMM|nr:glycosyltransferase family 2 protein [Crenothrix polyspora]SJM96175.1 putative Glycosyl transferase family 2 [Crenothrix polyspora]
MQLKVSVIMPAYNCAKYIGHALDSIQLQSIPEWEVIVIDDGSTDETADIVDRLAVKDSRIRLLRQPASGKPSIARNTGLAVAVGEFVCFLDADDFYAPTKFASCLNAIEQYPDVGLVFHDVSYVDTFGKVLPDSYLERSDFKANAEKFLVHTESNSYCCGSDFYFFISTANNSTLLISSVFIRRKYCIRFSNELLVGEDLDLWLRLLSQSMQFMFVEDVLAYYRRHDNNLTAHQPPIERDRIILHEINYFRSRKIFSFHQRWVYRGFIAHLYSNGGFGLGLINKDWDGFKAFLNSLLWLPNWFASKGCIKALGKILRSKCFEAMPQ